MKSVKTAILVLSLVGSLGIAPMASADGGFAEADFGTSYFLQMRSIMMKLNAADKKKAADMEMAIMKMETEHAMAMTKASMEHKMAIMKMRQEYESFIFSRVGGGF